MGKSNMKNAAYDMKILTNNTENNLNLNFLSSCKCWHLYITVKFFGHILSVKTT